MSRITNALHCDPVFVDDFLPPYGPAKHPDHEYVEGLLKSIGFRPDYGSENARYRNHIAATYICVDKFSPVEDEFFLLWQRNKNSELEFFVNLFTGEEVSFPLRASEDTIPVSDIKSIEENGKIILSDNSVFCEVQPANPLFIRAMDVLENSGFKMMYEWNRSVENTSPILFKKSDEIVGLYRDVVTDDIVAHRVLLKDVDGKTELESQGIQHVEEFLQTWRPRNFRSPRSEPSA